MCAAAVLGAAPAPPPLRGFSAAANARERADEIRFLDVPSAQGALDHATAIGARPHYAGSYGDRRLAEYVRGELASYGLDATIEPFTTRVDTPKRLVLELFASGAVPRPVKHGVVRRGSTGGAIGLDLREPAIPGDPATEDPAVGLPFNAGAADGEVTGRLVYANRGLDADYATLRAGGVDVRGAVVLVRYGAQFRGLLAERAQRNGAAAVVFYNDPADDGAARGLVFPDGPYRPAGSVQRGWVGDNLRIPTLPISAANARTLLAALSGPPGPAGWTGALDAAYPIASGPARVHLVVQMARANTTLWNVIGRLHGTLDEQLVVAGAHRDAWVYGVTDNGSGVTTLLEVARGLGYLKRTGWRPRRGIVLAFWDGEEIGLRGSAAYVAAHRGDLRGAIAYLNADQMVVGPQFAADAVPALATALLEATRAVEDPGHARTTVYDRWTQEAAHAPVPRTPGGGSDHEAFLYDLGIPVASMGFFGPLGPYHATADDLAFATRIADPGFALHRSAAQLYGILTMRLADADENVYSFAPYAAMLHDGLERERQAAIRTGLTVDLSPLADALARFSVSGGLADARRVGDVQGMQVVRDLDRVAFGRSGYEGVAFPELDAAIARRDSAAVSVAVTRAAAAIDRAARGLAP